MELMQAVWPPAVARVREEVADMQKIADAEKAGIRIEPWDYRYYAEKVRKAKYDLDETEVTPYMQLENLREGMFYMAKELFGFGFKPVDPAKVPVYHPDVRVWEVNDAQGNLVGLWYFDPYARKGKRSGAWMNAYRTQERFDGDIKTIVSNNSNFVKGKPGEPVLISWKDAETLFHEFGHALHGLSSNVNYPSLAGTAVPRDYVEFPSQLLEHWLSTPEILNKYALHVPDRQADPARARREDRGRRQVQQGLRHGRVPVERARRHEAAPRRRADDRPGQVRARDARGARDADRDRDASPHAAVQPRVLRRRLFGRLLQLPVVGHDHRGRVGSVHAGRRRLGQGRRQEAQVAAVARQHDRSRPTPIARFAVATRASAR